MAERKEGKQKTNEKKCYVHTHKRPFKQRPAGGLTVDKDKPRHGSREGNKKIFTGSRGKTRSPRTIKETNKRRRRRRSGALFTVTACKTAGKSDAAETGPRRSLTNTGDNKNN